MEASNDYSAQMEKRLADFPDKEEIANHLLTIQQLRVELEAARVKGLKYSGEVEDLTRKLNLADQEKVVAQHDLEAMGEKCKIVLEVRDVLVRRACHRARRFLAKEWRSFRYSTGQVI